MKIKISTECLGCSGDIETTLKDGGKFKLEECEFCDEKISVSGFVKVGETKKDEE